MRKLKMLDPARTKRGDTIIEAMFSFAIFSLVAIITVSMINLGVAASERSLELVTARNELNGQAEALRFIHSSYISELSLPRCDDAGLPAGAKCQQYAGIWKQITDRAKSSPSVVDGDEISIEYPLSSCHEVYQDDNKLLVENNAFVINTRELFSGLTSDLLIFAQPTNSPFQEAPLNARIVYSANVANGESSADQISSLSKYTRISSVEGIWVVGVKGPTTNATNKPQYYDFFIETCWYGSNNPAPTSLDAVVRLYNPEGA